MQANVVNKAQTMDQDLPCLKQAAKINMLHYSVLRVRVHGNDEVAIQAAHEWLQIAQSNKGKATSSFEAMIWASKAFFPEIEVHIAQTRSHCS